MSTQKEKAKLDMIDWLSDEHELGKVPNKIECVDEFDLHDMHYYVFKYKASILGKWLLGVCGGYEETSMEHCGHVFSEMQPYDPATAKEKAIEMVEMVRAYWMKEAEKYAENSSEEGDAGDRGCFVGFVLLDACTFDQDKLKEDLMQDWDIPYVDIPNEEENGAEENSNESLIFDIDGNLVAVSLMPAPVPDGEAEANAANNFMWPDAVEITKKHTAHLMVAVMKQGDSALLDIGQIYVKICAACLKQKNAVGLYASGTVFQPEFYLDTANAMKEGSLPIFNWIYLGLYANENGSSGYTYGMEMFGKKEIEVLNSSQTLEDIYTFLSDIAAYVLSSDACLLDGETIGFSENEKLTITVSPGVALDGETIKIDF